MPLPFTTSSPFFTALIVLCAAPVMSSPLPIPPTCRSNLTIIWHLILFYAANYIAHAAAVPVPLSARHIRVRIGRLKFILPLHGVLALVLPLSGILASLHLALRSLDYDEMALAWYTQALGVVTRTDDWTPPEGREERVPVRLPDTSDSTQDEYVAADPFIISITRPTHLSATSPTYLQNVSLDLTNRESEQRCLTPGDIPRLWRRSSTPWVYPPASP